MKKRNKYFSVILLSLLTLNVLHAEVPAEGTDAPAPNYEEYFTSESSVSVVNGAIDTNNSDTEEALIGDDGLPKDTIEGAFTYTSETGVSSTESKIDSRGIRIIEDKETGEQFTTFDEKPKTEEYTEARDAYFKSIEDNESVEVQRDKLDDAKVAAKNETFRHEYSLKNYTDTLTKGLEPAGAGRSIVNERYLQPAEDADEADQNTSQFYRENFTFLPDNASADNIKSTNVGKIKQAYDYVADMESLVKSKTNSGTISCYISRKLMPAFYCPYPDMTNTLYPDFSNPNGDPYKVSSAEAEKECNQNCYKERSCIPYNVLDNTELIPNIPEFNIWPFSDITTKEITTSNAMQIEDIEFDITVTKSENFEGTDEEFSEWLMSQSKPFKFKTDIIRVDNRLEDPIVVVFDKDVTNLRGTTIHKKYKILETGDKFQLKFYKPYMFKGVSGIDNLKNSEAFQNIGEIKISNFKVTYTNKDIYFCPFRQLVNQASECENGEVIDLRNSSSVLHICTNTSHRIGPDQVNGGFYTEEGCENACFEYLDCKPTYKHYANIDTNTLLKAEVGCVDSEDNSGCSDELCKSYFADGETRPLNEIVVQNDNTRVYTVKDTALTGISRPRINYDEEINSLSTDYDMTFQTEMKDQAFQAMIENQSYDRIKYTIGDPSPTKIAYSSKEIAGVRSIDGILKPNAFDFDNGQTYKLYTVIKYEQTYKPKYGIFMVDDHLVNATTQPIEFKDETYIIKQPDETWKVFKQINFKKVKKTKEVLYCDNGDGTTTETVYDGTSYYDPDTCRQQTQVYWSDIPAYTQDRNVFYIATNDSFANYSTSETAPAFVEQEFSSDMIENRYNITTDLFQLLQNAAGGTIRSQIEKQDGASFGRVYEGEYVSDERGYPQNTWIYLFYADHDLTYNEVIEQLDNPKNIIWELANQHLYPTEIKEDGEIYNNIRTFQVGNPNKTTVQMETTPKFNEEGQRVFKFMFLFDPAEDPFEGYTDNITDNTVTTTP